MTAMQLLNLSDAVELRPIDPVTEATREAIARCMEDRHDWREPPYLIGDDAE